MNKRKRQPNNQSQTSLKDHLTQYDPITLNRVLAEYESGIGWTVYKSYLKRKQRESEITALYKIAVPNGSAEASFASGYAKALDDVTEGFIRELIDLVNGKSQVVEEPRPEETE